MITSLFWEMRLEVEAVVIPGSINGLTFSYFALRAYDEEALRFSFVRVRFRTDFGVPESDVIAKVWTE